MTVIIENTRLAWNRWFETQGHHEEIINKRRRSDYREPIRLRGYSEFCITNITDRERKYLDTSLKRGYTLSRNNTVYKLLPLITQLCDFKIGYMGKTKSRLWFPNSDIRDRCLRLMEAQLVITDMFCANELKPRGDRMISINIQHDRGKAPKAHFKALRVVVDEFMAEWAQPREVFAQQVSQDNFIVRRPFDTTEKR